MLVRLRAFCNLTILLVWLVAQTDKTTSYEMVLTSKMWFMQRAVKAWKDTASIRATKVLFIVTGSKIKITACSEISTPQHREEMNNH